MPHTKSVVKRVELSRKARARNRAIKSRIRTSARKVREAETLEVAEGYRRTAEALIDRASRRRVLHPNRAARMKSQLSRLARSQT